MENAGQNFKKIQKNPIKPIKTQKNPARLGLIKKKAFWPTLSIGKDWPRCIERN